MIGEAGTEPADDGQWDGEDREVLDEVEDEEEEEVVGEGGEGGFLGPSLGKMECRRVVLLDFGSFRMWGFGFLGGVLQ